MSYFLNIIIIKIYKYEDLEKLLLYDIIRILIIYNKIQRLRFFDTRITYLNLIFFKSSYKYSLKE